MTLSDLGSFLSGVGLLSQERDGEIVSSAGGGRYMGVSPKIGGKPPTWMVKIMENPIKMDDLGGPPLYLETSIFFMPLFLP